LDFAEEAARFAAGSFAEGDDADFILGLCVCEGDWYTGQEPQGDEALLSVGEAIILVGERQPFKHAWCVEEVETMLLEIDGTLALGSGETHTQV
jgi:hypothetical protein